MRTVERAVLNALANGIAALPPDYVRLRRFHLASSSEKPIHLCPEEASAAADALQ